MIDEYITGKFNDTLDLSRMPAGDARLKIIEQELESKIAIINLIGKSASSKIKYLIDRNKKRKIIERIDQNDSGLVCVDLTYVPDKSNATENSSYPLNNDEVQWLISGLKHNSYIKILQLSNQEALTKKLPELADAIIDKPIKAIYLKLKDWARSVGFLEKIMQANVKSLIKLELNLPEDYEKALRAKLQRNQAEVVKTLKKINTMSEFLQYIGSLDYVPASGRCFTGEEYQCLLLSKLMDGFKPLEITGTYSIRQFFQQLYEPIAPPKPVNNTENVEVDDSNWGPDKIFEEKVSASKTKEELIKAIQNRGYVVTRQLEVVLDKELISIINSYFEDEQLLDCITDRYGIRNKVMALKDALNSKQQDEEKVVSWDTFYKRMKLSPF